MEVSAEAKRIMVVALGKLYGSRTQRGGLRLHRSLLLSLVMKSARDIYHEAQATAERAAAEEAAEPREELRSPGREPRVAEDKENRCPAVPAQHSRKRRGKTAAEPDFLPCKRAKLDAAALPPQLGANSAYMGYVTCGGGVAAAPVPVPLHRAVAAC